MSLSAYYEVVKPERTLANVMTTAAGFLLACAWHIDVVLMAATIVGTTLIVASACALNNATDRRLDARMPRTKRRALVVGALPLAHVIGLAVVLGAVGFALLAVYVNWLTVLIGVIGYIDYVILYGWTKRHSVHSTLVGTVSGAAPIVAGYVAVTGRFDLTALLLACVMVFWQMAHFYAIGVYRASDYQAGGLPILPVVKGVYRAQREIMVYIGLFVLGIAGLSAVGFTGAIFVLVMLPVAVYWFWAGFAQTEPQRWGKSMFGVSLLVLLVFCAMLSVGSVLA